MSLYSSPKGTNGGSGKSHPGPGDSRAGELYGREMRGVPWSSIPLVSTGTVIPVCRYLPPRGCEPLLYRKYSFSRV